MSISGIGGTAPSGQAGATGTSAAANSAAFSKILAAFEKEAAKTPAERARDAVLKKHNLTEAGYEALPPDQKKVIDSEIKTAVQRVLQADKSKGFKGAENAASIAHDLTSLG